MYNFVHFNNITSKIAIFFMLSPRKYYAHKYLATHIQKWLILRTQNLIPVRCYSGSKMLAHLQNACTLRAIHDLYTTKYIPRAKFRQTATQIICIKRANFARRNCYLGYDRFSIRVEIFEKIQRIERKFDKWQ